MVAYLDNIFDSLLHLLCLFPKENPMSQGNKIEHSQFFLARGVPIKKFQNCEHGDCNFGWALKLNNIWSMLPFL